MIEITRITKAGGPLSKRIHVNDAGEVVSDGSACVMSRGSATRARLKDVHELAALIDSLSPRDAIALGRLRSDLPDRVEITTKARLDRLNGTADPDLIARSGEYFGYRKEALALALIDFDTKGMPADVRERVRDFGGFREALVSVLPGMADVASIVRSSTSSGLYRQDTGEKFSGSGGFHWFILVEDGSDVERFLRALHRRCWLHGFGWFTIGAAGQLLDRSLVDRMVGAPERLVFEGAPEVCPPLAQDLDARRPRATGETPLDTRAACPDLTVVEQSRLQGLQAIDAGRVAPEAAKARRAFISEQTTKIAARLGVSPDAATRIVERQCEGILLPGVELLFDDADLAGMTVADVLADPERFDGETLADPQEGLAYGKCKAKVLRRPDGTAFIHSFAHGRALYELRYDFAAVEAALRSSKPEDAPTTFWRMVANAAVTPDEQTRLRDLTRDISRVGARPLDQALKAARQRKAEQEARDRRQQETAAAAESGRVRLPAPPPDAPRLPVLGQLDEVLSDVKLPEPPMRDAIGRPVEVRSRAPMGLHLLTARGANADEPGQTRLPPPEQPLLTLHNRYTLAHEIERHIDFFNETKNGTQSVALHQVFVEHYMPFRDSKLPRVSAIVTAPLVLPDGSLLEREGLDRESGVVFRIDPKLREFIPRPDECGRAAVKRAYDFLANDWLCDVLADELGKAVLIAAALTIIERVLLPQRPAFIVTAGKRGGGKTTVLGMLILAVTGQEPAAAAWSASEEERRKAVFAYLLAGLPALVWDNIPLGTAIACPTIEKVLTGTTLSDRVLGSSEFQAALAYTIQFFTGNNITAKGDLASRVPAARLNVDRPDPENRDVHRTDPIAWTRDHRGQILRSLYTILLGNRLRDAAPKTRFKPWWSLVGSAVEHAASLLDQSIDFGVIFAASEENDEETGEHADALEAMHAVWPARFFRSSDVVRAIYQPMVGEDGHARTLQEYFEPPGRRRGPEITSKSVGKRLAQIVDTPMLVDGRTMTLRREKEGVHGASYKIDVS